MRTPHYQLTALLLALLACLPVAAQEPTHKRSHKHHKDTESQPVLWRDPGDIGARDLFWGPGGKQDEPQPPFKFLKEDLNGHNPKFDVEDARGTKWRVKLGKEAQPEIVASRLLWAIGYFANENYFVTQLRVNELPQLERGENFMKHDQIRNVRLQRHPEKRTADWGWQHNPFVGTREFNGLRVMMALLSNWDLKDDNNAILAASDSSPPAYEVSDVGSTFGGSGRGYLDDPSKNNLKAYRKSKFIAKVTDDHVDFNFPRRPPLLYSIFAFPLYWHQVHMRWVGNHVPRADAKWVGSLLSQLSDKQIRDAFRAGGYTPEQVEGFANALEQRIAELKKL